jgi:hypothetical protein
MSQHDFQPGDRVRHEQRPEWGVGSVTKVERCTTNGRPAQRLSVRFPNAGLKALNTAHAPLARAEDATADQTDAAQPVVEWDRLSESGWLGSVAHRKVDEVMIILPLDARDPFLGLEKRLLFTLDLYRFDRAGRSLMDWAVAQSGLEDPLSRFTRHELEQLFDRWATERDNHLARLLHEAADQQWLDRVLKSAPPQARGAVRRLSAAR